MREKEELLDEIMEQVRQISLEEQKRVLDVVKAMVYTREILKKENESVQGENTCV